MSTAVLVRCIHIDDEVQRLAAQLRPFFGEDVWFVQDRYADAELPALSIEGQGIRVARAWLARHGLPQFSKAGWQCGDFVFYAGAEALPQYDRFWMIEADVYMNLDVKGFFGRLEALDADYLGASFEKAPKSWYWYPAAQGLSPDVYKSFFPIGRLSRRAIEHLLTERRAYSARPEVAALDLQKRERILYANDESFVSTVLMRDGFACQSIRALMPEELKGGFNLTVPILDVDVDHYPGKVLHPFCDPVRARKKFRGWAGDPRAIPKVMEYRDAIIARHGAETWARYCDLDLPAS